MQIIGGILWFVFMMAFLNKAAPAVANAIDMVLGLGFIAVVAYVLFHIASAGSRAVQKGAEFADNLLVKHPAEPIVHSALRTRKRIDTNALQDALAPSAGVLDLRKPLYHYKNQTKKARALKEKLDEDAAVAHAAIRRERARAELEDAGRELQVANRRRHRRSS